LELDRRQIIKFFIGLLEGFKFYLRGKESQWNILSRMHIYLRVWENNYTLYLPQCRYKGFGAYWEYRDWSEGSGTIWEMYDKCLH
jgi:hypothetical protein